MIEKFVVMAAYSNLFEWGPRATHLAISVITPCYPIILLSMQIIILTGNIILISNMTDNCITSGKCTNSPCHQYNCILLSNHQQIIIPTDISSWLVRQRITTSLLALILSCTSVGMGWLGRLEVQNQSWLQSPWNKIYKKEMWNC